MGPIVSGHVDVIQENQTAIPGRERACYLPINEPAT